MAVLSSTGFDTNFFLCFDLAFQTKSMGINKSHNFTVLELKTTYFDQQVPLKTFLLNLFKFRTFLKIILPKFEEFFFAVFSSRTSLWRAGFGDFFLKH